MKTEIYLKDSPEESYSKWNDDLDFRKLEATSKVISILEICGKINQVALSQHYEYLAAIAGTDSGRETLYIIHLKEKRIEAVSLEDLNGIAMSFISNSQGTCIIIGTSSGILVSYNIEKGRLATLGAKHNGAVNGVSARRESEFTLSWTSSELLLWAWPLTTPQKRLKIDPLSVLIKADHSTGKEYIVGMFESGTLLAWDLRSGMKENLVRPPDGVRPRFQTFSLSPDGEWVIGSGSEAMILIYCLTTLRVTQMLHLDHSESLLGIRQIQFLPKLQYQYPKSYIIRTNRSILLVDFVKGCVVKDLKSRNYSIDSFFLSGDGFILGVLYSNGSCKLYTVPSFFPNVPANPRVSPSDLRDPYPDDEFHENAFGIISSLKSSKVNIDAKILLEETKWVDILEEYREFPSQFRKYIWACLLKLPKNYSVFNDLLTKARRNPAQVPARMASIEVPDSTLDTLKSVVSSLQFWGPFLRQFEALWDLSLPFVLVFDSDPLVSFETIAHVLMNHCRLWFSQWPSPPTFLIDLVESSLKEGDPQLYSHLQAVGSPSASYTWTPVSTGFSKVLSYEDWRVAWDHILVNEPAFLLSFSAAFTISLRGTLLKCANSTCVEELFNRPTWVPIHSIIKKAKHLYSSQPHLWKVEEINSPQVLLPKGALPPFDIGPSSSTHQKNSAKHNDRNALFRPTGKCDISTKDLLKRVSNDENKGDTRLLRSNQGGFSKNNAEKSRTGEEKALAEAQRLRRNMLCPAQW